MKRTTLNKEYMNATTDACLATLEALELCNSIEDPQPITITDAVIIVVVVVVIWILLVKLNK